MLLVYLGACSHLQNPSLEFPRDEEISCAAKGRGPRLSKLASSNVWDFSSNPSLERTQKILSDFKQGRIGAKARMLQLRNLSAKEIHMLLIKEGFRHQRVPLLVGSGETNRYWLKSGETQVGPPTRETMLAMDIYDAPDGSVVRVKAWGIPDKSGKTPRTFPHLSKSVVFDKSEECELFFFNCHLKVTWENEAFKVSDNGEPIPKSPNPRDGMKIPQGLSTADTKRWIDEVMDQAHIDLPVEYKDCSR